MHLTVSLYLCLYVWIFDVPVVSLWCISLWTCFLVVHKISWVCGLIFSTYICKFLVIFFKCFVPLYLLSPSTHQFSLVAQSCPALMNRSTPGLPVYHQLPESTQTHVHWVGDAIQPSRPLSSPSPPALNLSQHQGLFHVRHLLPVRHFTRSSMFLIIYSILLLTLLHLSYYLSIYLLVYQFNSTQPTVKPIYWVLNFGYYLFSKLEFLFDSFLWILVLY